MTTDPHRDPYRDEATHPVEQLRAMINQAILGLQARAHACPPSKLSDLASALAALENDGPPKTDMDLLLTLQRLAPQPVSGLALLMSRVLGFRDDHRHEDVCYPDGGGFFYPRSLRIEVIGKLEEGLAPEIELLGGGAYVPFLSRCSIREFLTTTPISGVVVSATCPITVRLYACPKAPEIRLIFRGDVQQPMLGTMPGFHSGPCYPHYRGPQIPVGGFPPLPPFVR